MPRLLVLTALAVLLPIAASAQVAPVTRGPLPPAQTPARGITVNGSALARIPATSARVSLTVMTSDRSLSLTAERLAPIVDALVKAGADPGSVHLPPNFAAPGASNIATISAIVPHPNVAEMQAGIVSVGASVVAQKNLVLTNAEVQLSAAECASAIDTARENAVKQARAKAESLARDLDVRVGGALNVTSFDQLGSDGSCTSAYNVNGGFNPQGPLAPNDYVTVQVSTNVTITYAIR